MEYFVMFCVTGFFLGLLGIREAYQAKKKEKQFRESLHDYYGSKLVKEYSPERFERIGSYYKKHADGKSSQGEILDDITWNDLNIDDVFKRMNYTFSASGEEYLYYTLRNTGKTKEELAHFEEVVQFFDGHSKERIKIQFVMSRLGHTGKFSLYDYLDHLDYLGERSNKKHVIANLLYLPMIVLAPFELALSLTGLAVLVIYNIITYFKEKGEVEPYIASFGYIVRLLTACDELLGIDIPVCKGEWEKIRRHRETLAKMQKGSFWVFTMSRSVGSGNPLDMVMDYVRMIFHVDLIQFNKMLSHVRMHIEDVDELITAVGYLETAIAVGSFRKSLPSYCVPDLLTDKEQTGMHLADAYHPLLTEAVKNSIDTQKGVLLTGSNASGKSTFLKTVALNAILAQTIHTCTAAEYRAPAFKIYSSMSLRDDLTSGESYYIVEIKALKRILEAADSDGGKILCFVDEVLRGTNTVERIAASTQILRSLSTSDIMCFAATHDIELTDLVGEYFDNYHFEEEIRDGDVFFNYKLLAGKATTRNAIKLLEIMGYAPEIVEKATKQAESFVATGEWQNM